MNLLPRTAASRDVLILGANLRAAKIYRDCIERNSHTQYQIKGFVPLSEIDDAIPDRLVLRSNETLLKLARRVSATEIVIIKDQPDQVCPVQQLLDCKLAGLHLASLESFLDSLPDENQETEGSFHALLAACTSFRWH